MPVRAHLHVTGSVQGIGFRYFAYQHAAERGLTGFAKNLIYGDVEIEAQGERAAVDAFIAQIRQGPAGAQVENVAVEWIDVRDNDKGFATV